MIVSEDHRPNQSEFESLVNNATLLLNNEAKSKPEYFAKRHGTALEVDVFEAMKHASKGTRFDGSIQLLSGHSFPDILAMNLFGAEVKSTSQDHWVTAGNSIKETTRIDGIERIYLVFGKLAAPVEFKSRKYEDCLREVVVTHSPRYRIDMQLEEGQTIFDQLGMSYDELRATGDPIGEIVKFYRGRLLPGESLWWAGSVDPSISDNRKSVEQEASSPFTLRPQQLVPIEEKDQLLVKGLSIYTEVFGSDRQKYSRFSLWLATTHSIIPTSIRDWFSAGGKVDITVGDTTFNSVPQVFAKVNELWNEILDELTHDRDGDVRRVFGSEFDSPTKRIAQWTALTTEYGRSSFPSVQSFLYKLTEGAQRSR